MYPFCNTGDGERPPNEIFKKARRVLATDQGPLVYLRGLLSTAGAVRAGAQAVREVKGVLSKALTALDRKPKAGTAAALVARHADVAKPGALLVWADGALERVDGLSDEDPVWVSYGGQVHVVRLVSERFAEESKTGEHTHGLLREVPLLLGIGKWCGVVGCCGADNMWVSVYLSFSPTSHLLFLPAPQSLRIGTSLALTWSTSFRETSASTPLMWWIASRPWSTTKAIPRAGSPPCRTRMAVSTCCL